MKFLWAAVMAMLVSLPARAGTLNVLDLRLHPEPTWQRGTPQQELEDEALLLSWPVPDGVALQVLVPRNPPRIKSDADTFYRNLSRKWSALYGKQAAMGWLDFTRDGQTGPGGPRWLSCRRPTRSGDGVVFHLATVHEGRAYSLLVFAPPKTEALPQAVHRLLAGAGFQAVPSVWRQVRGLVPMPRSTALEALVQADADALGDQGMITGYGVNRAKIDKQAPGSVGSVDALRLEWFLDGFRWVDGAGRDERLPFEAKGELSAEASQVLPGGAVHVGLNLAASDTPLAARVSLHAYCGPRGPWDDALADLARGARRPLERLGRDHACPGIAGDGVLATLEARPGEAVARAVALMPPPESADGLWVEIRLLPEAGSLGEGLLGRLGLYFFYEPER